MVLVYSSFSADVGNSPICFLARKKKCLSLRVEGFHRHVESLTDGLITNILFRELMAKFVGGILALSTGLSLGREGPSVQIGSYVGYLVSKWGRVLSGERKQLLAAGAGAGLAAAFAAPLASSLLVIESIERFDAPKNGYYYAAGGEWLPVGSPVGFSYESLFSYRCHCAGNDFFGGQVKLFLLLAAVISIFGKTLFYYHTSGQTYLSCH